MEKVRWGVIGAGDVCERKAGSPLYKIEGSVMATVHRRNAVAGKDFAVRHGDARYVSDPDAFFTDPEIDAIYVATPHDLHRENTTRALHSGKHVLVENPMAMSTADCDEMIRTAVEADRSLGVAYYRRGYPSIQKIKALIESGEIGEPESMSLNGEFPTSHRLDLVHFFLGDVARVSATAPSKGIYSPEDVTQKIDIETVTGVNVTMVYGWVETGMPEALAMAGTKGEIYLQDLKGGEITLRRGSRAEQLPVSGLPYTHWGLIENFVAHLRVGAPLLCDGEAGRKSTVVLDALLRVEPGSGWADVRY